MADFFRPPTCIDPSGAALGATQACALLQKPCRDWRESNGAWRACAGSVTSSTTSQCAYLDALGKIIPFGVTAFSSFPLILNGHSLTLVYWRTSEKVMPPLTPFSRPGEITRGEFLAPSSEINLVHRTANGKCYLGNFFRCSAGLYSLSKVGFCI